MLAKFLCRELAALHGDEPIRRNRVRELRWAMPLRRQSGRALVGGRLLMRAQCIKPSGPWRTSGGGCLASASLSDIAIKRLPGQRMRRIMSLVALFL